MVQKFLDNNCLFDGHYFTVCAPIVSNIHSFDGICNVNMFESLPFLYFDQ